MCGIAGILMRDATADPRDAIRSMTSAMAHRGPDADGMFVEGGLALGHRRLSIIDLSEGANQPFHDASGRYVMVFNGELYNYMEVRRNLPDYPFRTQGDTEVLLAAFAKWGPSCVTRFAGMFAFAVWDRQDRVLTLCRDRMGVKPLYFFHGSKRFIFSSELRSIAASGLMTPHLDREALADFLTFQSFGFPHSPLLGVQQMEAGSWMQLQDGVITRHRYWELGAHDPFGDDLNDAEVVRKRVRELLRHSVERRLVADVPVGAFLSGGIDSSVIVGLMAELSTGRPETFNISFAEESFDESAYAEKVAKRFNTNHHTIRLQPNVMLEEFENALDALDSPSGDGINTYVVSKAIRRAGITVALSGVGGDELFCGYPFFRTFKRVMNHRGAFDSTGSLRNLAASVAAPFVSGRRGRMVQLLRTGKAGIREFYPLFRQILPPKTVQALLGDEDPPYTPLQKQLSERRDLLDHHPLYSQVSIAEYLGYTQQVLLKDTDQMSMANSLEVREPFFDHDLVGYMLAVPDAVKEPHGYKKLLVDAMHPMLPDEIVHRTKKGFVFPWDIWMRRELRSYCDRHVRAFADRGLVDKKVLLGNWDMFQKGKGGLRWTDMILFVVLERWMEKNGIDA